MPEKLALGTAQFGLDYGINNSLGKTPEKEVSKILSLAEEAGINCLDTAYAYGTSEETLGRNNLNSFKIVSKFPSVEPSKNLNEYLYDSLKKLNTKAIYGYLAHNSQVLIQNQNLWDELQSAKKLGKVKKIGYSLYQPSELHKLLELGMFPDLIQVPFNILDQRFRHDLIGLAKEGVEIHTRSCFLQGVFFQDPQKLDAFFEKVKPFLADLALNYPTNSERAAFLLDYCTSQPFIHKVVIGVNNYQQLSDNLTGQYNKNGSLLMNIPTIPDKILLPTYWPS
ncbi:MAG: aldo/keto reductase [Saprospiraceae bacterium]|nr:MAG: aldo/keto reductase [Saprospiraceae bacterium]